MTRHIDLDQMLSREEPLPRQAYALTPAQPQHLSPSDVRQVYHCAVPQCPHLVHLPADGVIIAWLDEKTGKSGSWKTHVAYHSTVLSLRETLQTHGYDLLDDLSDDARYASYLLIVQGWAGSRATNSHHKAPVSASTYNHRLATISSFFDYAKRMRLYRGDNPIDAIARRKLGDQKGAKALDMVEMRKRLARIDRASDAGRRDYALLSVALQTGSRVQALADMRVRDLTWSGDRLTIHFPRTKGGETDEKELEVETSRVLATYLQQRYGERWQDQRDAAIWISYARNDSYGQKLSVQALEQICKKHIGTSMFHTLRHTAGLTLEELGATTSEVQSFLRHKNIATTSTYLKRAKRAKNKYGRDLEQVFGISAATH
ncbi:MAG: site-specific integrase [Ktedonobacteraceae bacterium]|nr:site-specific integrase [Ktedonobacteraceae bacterium]MBO0792291.1 site-specific integrase [Ktedonobacteraceae bacterium]